MIACLPPETFAHIYSFIEDPKDIYHCVLVCKIWKTIIDENWWKQMVASLQKEDIEYTLLPNYKHVFKEWWTVDRKIIESIDTPPRRSLFDTPLINWEGMRKIIRHMCGKKKYDMAFECHDVQIGFNRIPMDNFPLVKGIDSLGRHFIAVQYMNIESGRIFQTSLSESCYVRYGSEVHCWQMLGCPGIAPQCCYLIDTNFHFCLNTYRFFKNLIRHGEVEYNLPPGRCYTFKLIDSIAESFN